MAFEQFRNETEAAVTLLCLPTEEASRNVLHPDLDVSKTITGKESARKTLRKIKVPMTEDGTCPFSNCNWVCKSLKSSTFAMHISNKHKFEVGTSLHTYMCGTCNRIFDSRSILNNHIVAAHDRPLKPWKWGCFAPNCSYKSQSKAGILDHFMRKHGNLHADDDCIDKNSCCFHCGEKRTTKNGHMNHLAVCLGFGERAERNKLV